MSGIDPPRYKHWLAQSGQHALSKRDNQGMRERCCKGRSSGKVVNLAKVDTCGKGDRLSLDNFFPYKRDLKAFHLRSFILEFSHTLMIGIHF